MKKVYSKKLGAEATPSRRSSSTCSETRGIPCRRRQTLSPTPERP
jgi:hypothetical protein